MRHTHALCPKTKRVSDPMQVTNATWFQQGAEQRPGENSSIYPSTEKSKGRLPCSSALQGPSPSLLRNPLSSTSNPFPVMPAISAGCSRPIFWNIPGDTESHERAAGLYSPYSSSLPPCFPGFTPAQCF